MRTSKTPSLKPLQDPIQKAPNLAGENSLKETHKSIKCLVLPSLSVRDQSCRARLLRHYMQLVSSAALKTAKIIPSTMISS